MLISRDALQTRLNELNNIMYNTESENKVLLQEMGTIRKELLKLRKRAKEINPLRKKVEELYTETDKLQQEIRTLQQLINKLKRENEKLSEENDHHFHLMNTKDVSINEMENEKKMLASEIDSSRKRLDLIESELASDLEIAERRAEEAEEREKKYLKELYFLREAKEQQEKEITVLKEQRNDLTSLVEELEMQEAPKGESLMDELLGAAASSDGEQLREANLEIESLKGQMMQMSSKKQELKDSLKELESKLEETEVNLRTVREQLPEKDVLIEKLQSRIKELEELAAQPAMTPRSSLQFTDSDEVLSGEGFLILNYVNSVLAKEVSLSSRLPIGNKYSEFASATVDGVILWYSSKTISSLSKLLNHSIRGTIDERVIKLNPLTEGDMQENHSLFINSAIGVGCPVYNFSSNDLIEGKVDKTTQIMFEIIRVGTLENLLFTPAWVL